MKKITYRLWLVAIAAIAFIGTANAQNNTKVCMKVGINMNPVGSYNIFPFKDFFKTNWGLQSSDSVKDNNGYPLSGYLSATLDVAGLFEILKSEHILSWDGAVTSEKSPLRSRISPLIIIPNSFKKTLTGGFCKVKLDSSIFKIEQNLTITFLNPTPTTDIFKPQHIRNIKLIRAGFENTDIINYPFNAEFVNQMNPFNEIDFRSAQFLFFSDTTNNVAWKDRITPASFTQNSFSNSKKTSFAYEHMIQLCNETNANASLYFPICADENYLFQMATLFKNNLKNKQTITLYPAAFAGLSTIIAKKAKEHPIYKNDLQLAMADYTGRAWRIWRQVFGIDSSRVIRGIETYSSVDDNLIKIANFHGKGNFDIIHGYGYIWEIDSTLIKPTLSVSEAFNSVLNSIKSNNKGKEQLRKLLAASKIYNVKTTLADLVIPSAFPTSDTTGVYFTESQIDNLTRLIMDTLSNMGVSISFTTNHQSTFEPKKLNEGGIRVAAPYFAVVNNLPTEGDCAKPSAVESATNLQLFQVFPNPTTGEVTLTSSKSNMGDKLKIECYNSLGASIYAGEMMLNESANILQNQSVGIYNLIITTAEGKKYQQKILKN